MVPTLTCPWENQTCIKCSFVPVAEMLQAVGGNFQSFLQKCIQWTVFWCLVQSSRRCVFSRDDICNSGRDWTECTLAYLVTLVETCSLAHWSSCERKLGFKSPYTCKRNGDFFKKTQIYLLNPSLTRTWLCGNQAPQAAPQPPCSLLSLVQSSFWPTSKNLLQRLSADTEQHRLNL